jgi:hypothetical protein
MVILAILLSISLWASHAITWLELALALGLILFFCGVSKLLYRLL